nr:Rrf2 family transcriptional regulator [Paenibacillus gorillae]
MSINTQFPVAVHILAFSAIVDGHITSDFIATSVNTNPVVIRRINTLLKKAGLIKTHSGVGGVSLNYDPKEIKLLDIYKAVTNQQNSLFDVHNAPNPECPVGSNIHESLKAPLIEAQLALENSLARYTLDDIIQTINELNLKK